jgi:hypothetical protein
LLHAASSAVSRSYFIFMRVSASDGERYRHREDSINATDYTRPIFTAA